MVINYVRHDRSLIHALLAMVELPMQSVWRSLDRAGADEFLSECGKPLDLSEQGVLGQGSWILVGYQIRNIRFINTPAGVTNAGVMQAVRNSVQRGHHAVFEGEWVVNNPELWNTVHSWLRLRGSRLLVALDDRQTVTSHLVHPDRTLPNGVPTDWWSFEELKTAIAGGQDLYDYVKERDLRKIAANIP